VNRVKDRQGQSTGRHHNRGALRRSRSRLTVRCGMERS
jgi:hypothetical protein